MYVMYSSVLYLSVLYMNVLYCTYQCTIMQSCNEDEDRVCNHLYNVQCNRATNVTDHREFIDDAIVQLDQLSQLYYRSIVHLHYLFAS